MLVKLGKNRAPPFARSDDLHLATARLHVFVSDFKLRWNEMSGNWVGCFLQKSVFVTMFLVHSLVTSFCLILSKKQFSCSIFPNKCG